MAREELSDIKENNVLYGYFSKYRSVVLIFTQLLLKFYIENGFNIR